MVFVDEVQDARQPVIDRTVRPILSGARVVNPQAWFAGTGERDESEVLRGLRRAGVRPGADTLWLEWSAPPGCCPTDEDAWRWASPDWSESRRESLAADLRTMQEVDFRSEYLVQHDAQVTLWLPGWPGLRVAGPVWSTVAVECAPGSSRPCVAFAGLVDGRVVVGVQLADSMAHAAALVRSVGTGAPVVGKALLSDPVWSDLGAVPMTGTSVQALAEFRQLVDEGVLVHDGSDLLAEQVAAVRMEPAAGGGLRLTSLEPVDAIKAALWAAQAAREVGLVRGYSALWALLCVRRAAYAP